MALFDCLDARITTARWAAKQFNEGRTRGIADAEIVRVALGLRYQCISLSPSQMTVFQEGMLEVRPSDIYGLCQIIAEVELLNHLDGFDRFALRVGGENIVTHTYAVIDRELQRLGFYPSAPAPLKAPPPERHAPDTLVLKQHLR